MDTATSEYARLIEGTRYAHAVEAAAGKVRQCIEDAGKLPDHHIRMGELTERALRWARTARAASFQAAEAMKGLERLADAGAAVTRLMQAEVSRADAYANRIVGRMQASGQAVAA